MDELTELVREEVESLHRFFVDWFSGALGDDEFERGFEIRFASDLVFIPPAGSLLGLDDLVPSIRNGRGSNPDFRIAIRNVKVHRVLENHIIATYEEWQRNALASRPPDNARIATVVFERTIPLTWLHIHETWMPEEDASAGPYDF